MGAAVIDRYGGAVPSPVREHLEVLRTTGHLPPLRGG